MGLSVAIVKEKLAGIGITEFEDDLERIENTWLLLDDAQNWYGEEYVLAILAVFDQAVARHICGTCVYHHCNYVRSLHPGFTCSFWWTPPCERDRNMRNGSGIIVRPPLPAPRLRTIRGDFEETQYAR